MLQWLKKLLSKWENKLKHWLRRQRPKPSKPVVRKKSKKQPSLNRKIDKHIQLAIKEKISEDDKVNNIINSMLTSDIFIKEIFPLMQSTIREDSLSSFSLPSLITLYKKQVKTFLSKHSALTQERVQLFNKNTYVAMGSMGLANILTADNLYSLIDHLDGDKLMCGFLLNALFINDYLTQENFNFVCRHISLLSDDNDFREGLMFALPAHLLTRDLFNQIFHIIRTNQNNKNATIRALSQFMEQTLNPDGPRINYRQSVHNWLVERTVIISTNKLRHNYPDAYNKNLAKNVRRLKRFLNSGIDEFINSQQTDKDKLCHQAISAKRFIDKVINDSTHLFDGFHHPQCDGMTLQQALVLVWEAMHDKSNYCNKVTLNNAKESLIRQLFESQKAYVEDDNLANPNAGDLAACVAGSFNNIIASMHTILKDVRVLFFSKDEALMSLNKLIIEELDKYIQSLPVSERSALIQSLSSDGITQAIWNSMNANDRIKSRYIKHYLRGLKESITDMSPAEKLEFKDTVTRHLTEVFDSVANDDVYQAISVAELLDSYQQGKVANIEIPPTSKVGIFAISSSLPTSDSRIGVKLR